MREVAALFAVLLVGCATPSEPVPTYHPDGFASPQVHGPSMLLQQDTCNTCHGPELTGSPDAGTGFLSDVSCDDCHRDGWRDDCTYCHGGEENDTGAPPDGIGGTGVDFPHGAHVASEVQAARDCTLCHAEPDDVLSEGHIFDGTAGVAEVDMTGGVVPDVVWDGQGCSNNACHGDGQASGAVLLSDAPLGCDGCHVGPESELDEFIAMSGDHRAHQRHFVPCSDCHPNVDAANAITNKDAHVNLSVELDMPESLTVESGHCSGMCHDEQHVGQAW